MPAWLVLLVFGLLSGGLYLFGTRRHTLVVSAEVSPRSAVMMALRGLAGIFLIGAVAALALDVTQTFKTPGALGRHHTR